MDAYSPTAGDALTGRLVLAIAGVLLSASVIGCVLRWTLARRQAHPAIDELNRRIGAWWVIVASIGLAFLGGRAGVTVFFALCSAGALREFLTSAPSPPPARPQVLLSFLLILPLQYWLVWSVSAFLFGTCLPLLALIALSPLGRKADRTLAAAWLICLFGLSHIPAVLTLPIAGTLGDPLHLPLFLLLVTQASDVLQYAWGKLLGRRPIAPRLSPSKTLEGTLGGLLSAVALGAALAPLTPFSPAGAAGVSLLLTLLGFAGGLSLSAIKRRRGIKDWGTLIPGHGGLLDRLDSLYLSAPAFYYLLRFGGIS